MSRRLRFFFDYSSPFAYLGAKQVEAVAAKHAAPIAWEPFLLGGLFHAIGTPNVPLLAMSAAKEAFARADMVRWAEYVGARFAFPTRFPMNTVAPLRMTLCLPNDARPALAHAMFEAYWADDRDLADPDTLIAVADAAGYDGAALLKQTQDPAIKLALRQATEGVQALGLVGAPSFVVEEDGHEPILFWGQDRLAMVDRALGGWRPRMG